MKGPNLMQRVYDAMTVGDPPASIDDLATRAALPRGVVVGALRRLRAYRVLRATNAAGVWRYAVRDGASRPRDRRGARRD